MKITLKNVRLSFPDLFEATQFQGAGPSNFGASFLIDPTSPTIEIIEGAIKSVAAEKWAAKAPAVLKSLEGNSQKSCFYSGDSKTYDGYEGNMVLSAKRAEDKGRPMVVDKDNTPLVAQDGKPYAGCTVNASVELWAQDNQYGKGIRATLRAVQFVKDGDRFSGSEPAGENEFDDLTVNEDSLV